MREFMDPPRKQRKRICVDVRGKTNQDYRRVQGFNMSTKIDKNGNPVFLSNIYKIVSISVALDIGNSYIIFNRGNKNLHLFPNPSKL